MFTRKKMEDINDKLCREIWGDVHVEWRFVPAVNHTGGVLCL